MNPIQLSRKISLSIIFLAQSSFGAKIKIARLTPAERKQILDDARAYDLKNKEKKHQSCTKGDKNCEEEKTRTPDSKKEKPKDSLTEEKKQTL